MGSLGLEPRSEFKGQVLPGTSHSHDQEFDLPGRQHRALQTGGGGSEPQDSERGQGKQQGSQMQENISGAQGSEESAVARRRGVGKLVLQALCLPGGQGAESSEAWPAGGPTGRRE